METTYGNVKYYKIMKLVKMTNLIPSCISILFKNAAKEFVSGPTITAKVIEVNS